MYELKYTAGRMVFLAHGPIGEYAKVLDRFADVEDYAPSSGEVVGGEDGYMWIARAGVEWKTGDCER